MAPESRTFGLPLLDVNPFSSRPLEAGDAGKLIGREEEFMLLRSYLRLGTARRIMLTGPLGSGRTSLARCLIPYAGAYISIDHLPVQAPARAMLESFYRQLIGGQPPSDRDELVKQLVNEMYAYNDKLPLVVIDVPASDLSVVDVALRDAHSLLERLNAIVILVCDVKDRHQLPVAVVSGFEPFQLGAYSVSDIVQLVEHRLSEVGVLTPSFTDDDARSILDQCDGYPASVIATLRDAVDRIRLQQSEGIALPYRDTSARLQPREEEPRLNLLMGEGVTEPLNPSAEVDPLEEQADGVAQAEAGLVDRSLFTPPPEGDEKGDGTFYDASVPWNQRQSMEGPDEETPAEQTESGFDLDIEFLNTDRENDEPLQPSPFSTPIIDASSPPSLASSATSGPFGSLVQRNKAFKDVKDEVENDARSRSAVLEDYSEAAEWWVEKESLPNPPEQPVPEASSAALIHDEVGLPTAFDDEVEASDFLHEDALTTDTIAALTEPSTRLPGDEPLAANALEALVQLLGARQGDVAALQPLLAFFEGRRVERYGPKQDYPLDKVVLGVLSPAEAYVVAVAHERAFSPSDAAMLNHLAIKRARLSQISNRLLKHGILQARTVGRARKYSLTQAARAQLIAWGALKGGEA
ncbi:MAG: ATP-binding protein [Poseidonia sp.]